MPGKFLWVLKATRPTLRNTASAHIPGAGLCGRTRLHEQAALLLGPDDQAYSMISKMSVAEKDTVEFMEYPCWRISVQAPRFPKVVQAICGRETHTSEKPSGAVVVMTEGKKSGEWEEGQGGTAASRRAVVPLRKRDPPESWRAPPEWRHGSVWHRGGLQVPQKCAAWISLHERTCIQLWDGWQPPGAVLPQDVTTLEPRPHSSLVVVEVHAQLCPTLCSPVDCNPPGSSVHGVFQAGILEWVAMPSSRGSSWPMDRTCVSWVSCTELQADSLPLGHLGSPHSSLVVLKQGLNTTGAARAWPLLPTVEVFWHRTSCFRVSQSDSPCTVFLLPLSLHKSQVYILVWRQPNPASPLSFLDSITHPQSTHSLKPLALLSASLH